MYRFFYLTSFGIGRTQGIVSRIKFPNYNKRVNYSIIVNYSSIVVHFFINTNPSLSHLTWS